MGINQINIVSITNDRPTDIVIGVIGSYRNTCVKTNAKVKAERDDRTIHLSATMNISDSGADFCGQAVTEVYGEVTVEDLEVGEYKVMAEDIEITTFRIEEDAGYVKTAPIINYIYITMKDSNGAVLDSIPHGYLDPVHVTIEVKGNYEWHCDEYLKTHISQNGDNEIIIDISNEVKINETDCAISLHPIFNEDIGNYSVEFDLGEFTNGDYTVIVNGYKWSFSI